MKIEILGTGCAKCNALEKAARAAAGRLGLKCEFVHVTDLRKFAAYGVMLTPALVVDGVVRLSGRLATEKELLEILGGQS
ncbi:MAG: thioredoxin family protein [Planctomycetota bacterium]